MTIADLTQQIEETERLIAVYRNADDVIAEMKVTSDEITALDIALREIEEKLNGLLDTIPNIPHESVPHGEDASGTAREGVAAARHEHGVGWPAVPREDDAQPRGAVDRGDAADRQAASLSP